MCVFVCACVCAYVFTCVSVLGGMLVRVCVLVYLCRSTEEGREGRK